jgi:hypothetical protein
MAQLAISVAGAAIGFAVGGPAGAQWGWMAGNLVGSVLFPPHIEGPHMADLKVQNSAYGQPIPVIYGTYRLSGNVIWADKPVEHSQTQGGKGGPSTTTYSYTLSFAVGLCEGPIVGIRRIWANGKLIYDMGANASAANVLASSILADGITAYPGSETQEPDPTMESVQGVGNVPGYRGMAYVVFTDFDLSPYGNYLPSFSFEVVTASNGTWIDQTVSSWTFHTALNTFFSAPCLSMTDTIALAWGYYYGYGGVYREMLTAYGSSPIPGYPMFMTKSPGQFPGTGRSDSPGALINGESEMTWIDANENQISTKVPNLPFGGNGTSYSKFGNFIWFSNSYGGFSYHLYRYDLYGGTGLVVSSTTGPWSVLGASASYVYVIDVLTGEIKKFDRNTLAYIDTVFTGAPTGASMGQVISDNLIYVAVSGAGIWRVDLDQNLCTNVFWHTGFPIVQSFEVLNDSAILYSEYVPTGELRLHLVHKALDFGGVTLGSIVGDICSRVGLQPSQYDVSQLTDQVRGYAMTNRSTAKSNLQPLMTAYFVDATDTNARLKFVKRGSTSVVTVPATDIGVASTKSAEESLNPMVAARTQELELPQVIEMTYPGVQNDYENATQRAFRSVTSTVRQTAFQLPVVLADDEARQRCEQLLWSQWTSRTTYIFATSLAYLRYEPSDVVTVTDPDTGYTSTVRLTRCEHNGQGQLRWTAVSEDPTLYTNVPVSVGGIASGYQSPAVAYAGPTQLVILDVPPLRNSDTSQALYVAVCGYDSSWPGCQLQISRDGGVTYSPVPSQTLAATIGYTDDALGAFAGGNLPDESNCVVVRLINPSGSSLSSTDYNGLYAGTNAALIGQELVFFRSATLLGVGMYRLSGLLRGRQGTEWAMNSHASGETFVLLNASTLLKLPLVHEDLGQTIKLLATTLGQTVKTANAVSVTVREACVRPLAPSGFMANKGSAASANDIALTWTRCARVNAGWLNGTDVPLDESAESYQVQVFSGTTMVRTVVVTGAQSWVYADATITADGFTSGQTISFTVAQNSDEGVLGHAASATAQR